jgi:hypothetical protein
MNAAIELMERARAAGVEVIVKDGELKARGPTDALVTWAPALRPHKTELMALLTGEPEPRPDWRVLDKAYQLHHWRCAMCCAAGRRLDGVGRCAVGALLWSTYQEACR